MHMVRHFLLRLVILLPLWLAYGLALPAVAQTESEDRGYLQGLLEDNLSGVGREVRITGFEGALSARAAIVSNTPLTSLLSCPSGTASVV